ncbi:hypothetical protein SB581_04960 [Acinetobacter baumannii]|nr:hypothetical protein EA770_04625 [Acinetobacter baumannii]WPE82330.1 hypothetical protein SB581_04960 [Acinetobacter baumannii]
MNVKKIIIIIGFVFSVFGIGFYFYFSWGESKNYDEIQCSNFLNKNLEDVYKIAMASYFQNIKEDIVFEKTKKKGDGNAKTFNAYYNLYVLKENIKDFSEFEFHLRNKVREYSTTYNSNMGEVVRKIDYELVFNEISYGSVVKLVSYSRVEDNYDIDSSDIYKQYNNKYSFLFTVDGGGGDKDRQFFYPQNCCYLIPAKDLNKFKERKNGEGKYSIHENKDSNYYLIVFYNSYQVNMVQERGGGQLIGNMKHIYKALPVDVCGRVNYR